MIASLISTNLLIQYILVAIIIAGAVIWIILKIIKNRKRGTVGCCNCSMASSCSKSTHCQHSTCCNPSTKDGLSCNRVQDQPHANCINKNKHHEDNKDME